jgi:uncharacterized protein YndB with AHSA1/START domain/phenylpyruvate tautomerase PptA (4-oxalocrotonate tautomerase family)
MPLVRIDLREGRAPDDVAKIGQAVHDALVEAIDVPVLDRFQVITSHPPHGLVFDPRYLGIPRTDGVVFVQITISAGRTLERKRALHAAIARNLHERVGTRPEDVFVNLLEVAKENWSFGNGEAQYARVRKPPTPRASSRTSLTRARRKLEETRRDAEAGPALAEPISSGATGAFLASPSPEVLVSTFRHTREIPASPEAVFEAIRDPGRLARWWGPDGFSNTFQAFEFRPGGRWLFTMHGPDGTDYPNQSELLEIVPGSRVRIRHVNLPHFELSISLEPSATGTLVSWVGVFENREFAEKMRTFLESANEQNLDRLTQEVGSVAPGGA